MSEELERQAVIAEAWTWVGTPFRDQGDRKGAGVDCVMMLIRCFVDTGVIAPYDPRPYPPRWHLHQGEERFLNWLIANAAETDEMRPGNILLYKEGRCFSHGALLVAPELVVHAAWREKLVLPAETFSIGLTHHPRSGKARERKIFDLWRRPQ